MSVKKKLVKQVRAERAEKVENIKITITRVKVLEYGWIL